MLEQLGTFATVVGLFHLFNELALDAHKRTLSGFLFGDRAVSFAGFEQSVIRSVLTPLLRDGRLRWRRVALLSLTVSFVLTVFYSNAFFDQIVEDDVPLAAFLPMFLGLIVVYALLSACLSWPFDWVTLRVSQYLFLDKSFPVPLLVPLILVVACVALLPPTLQIATAWYINGLPEFSGPEYTILLTVVMVSAFINGVTSILATAIQVAVLGVGLLSRAVVIVFKIGPILARHLKLQSYPVTYVGLIVGLVCTAVQG